MINGHGDDIYRYKDIRINFSSNVYNDFDHEDLFCHLADRLDCVKNYPEPAPVQLEKHLALSLGLQPDELMVTNGATEAIYLIAQTFRRKHSAILMPTFSEYADASRLHEHQVTNIYQLEQIHVGFQMVWLCNPNNPTGAVMDKEALVQSICQHPNTLFIIDASYAKYTDHPLLLPSEGCEMSNVLMLHSMTKEYGLPGLRLGYVTGPASLLEDVRRQRMPWSVNQIAIDAANYLLVHQDEFTIDLASLMAERERVAQQLSQLGGLQVWPSDSHILLCRLTIGKASALKDYLAQEYGILIRDASNFAGLDSSYFRIAVQSRAENDELIQRISEWIAQ
ncbi:MAG: pyridoxal phosphate-dependent class II aminotransferase [Bacteroidaceae bacterium]|nr:pyridoxal phosphate-dependent class II aminotransferase [Bacteroidaceae bacterium]